MKNKKVQNLNLAFWPLSVKFILEPAKQRKSVKIYTNWSRPLINFKLKEKKLDVKSKFCIHFFCIYMYLPTKCIWNFGILIPFYSLSKKKKKGNFVYWLKKNSFTGLIRVYSYSYYISLCNLTNYYYKYVHDVYNIIAN